MAAAVANQYLLILKSLDNDVTITVYNLTLRGRIKDAVETMCVTMWCICRVASTYIRKLSYVVHTNTVVI